jgi:hypothetical protein
MRASPLVCLLLTPALACRPSSVGPPPPGETPPKVEADAGVALPDGNPPPPPPSRELPAALAAALPRTDGGLPVLISGESAGVGGALAYDVSLDDAISHYGACVERALSCYRTNRPPIAGCVKKIEVCPDGGGGRGCCPQACIDAFLAGWRPETDERALLEKVFIGGDCVPGLAAQLAGGGP